MGKSIQQMRLSVRLDFPYAMQELIPNEKNRGKYTNKKNLSRMAYSCSCFLLYLGLIKKYEANVFCIASTLPKTSKKCR